MEGGCVIVDDDGSAFVLGPSDRLADPERERFRVHRCWAGE